MDRREILLGMLSAGAYAALPSVALANRDNIFWYGTSPPENRSDIPTFYQRYSPLKGISTLGKNVFLYQNLQKEIGDIVPHYQGPADDGTQGEGDCVGQACAMGCDILAATDIHMLGQSEQWKAKASVEMLYAGSRVEIGQKALRGGGGSRGEWAAKFVRDYGVLHRIPYEADGNQIDLTGYHPGRSRNYRDVGVPDWLEPISKEHPVKEITQVQSGREALDAVCSGQPVIMCSSYAFHNTRDNDGFATPYLSTQTKRGWRWIDARVQWWHAMILTSAILEGPKVGGTIQNSHGKWNSGPQPNSLPDGAFNVELQYLDMMVKDWFDCWALGSYHGHQAKRMKKHLLYLR
jgi:hypothetical protein